MSTRHGVTTQRHRPALEKLIAECVAETLSDAHLDGVAGANQPFTPHSAGSGETPPASGILSPRDAASGVASGKRGR